MVLRCVRIRLFRLPTIADIFTHRRSRQLDFFFFKRSTTPDKLYFIYGNIGLREISNLKCVFSVKVVSVGIPKALLYTSFLSLEIEILGALCVTEIENILTRPHNTI